MSHAASRCSARSEAKKVQFRAVANPTSQPREERRPACEHAGNITGHVKIAGVFATFGISSSDSRLLGVGHGGGRCSNRRGWLRSGHLDDACTLIPHCLLKVGRVDDE